MHLFPGLAGSTFAVTSPASPRYNCIAWAAEDPGNWWWPDEEGIGFWPAGVPREVTLAVFVAAFATRGYETCPGGDPEPGWQKIALDAKDGVPTHAGRLLPTGRWTSKLGPKEDIEHDLTALEGLLYGAVAGFMKRPLAPAGQVTETAAERRAT
jgi:hypothetical protein